MKDLEQDALDLVDLVSDQVRRLGPHSRTKKAISIFGHVGRQNQVSEFSGLGMNAKLESRKPRIQRTLTQLLLEITISLSETAISTVMLWAIVVIRWIWKTASANRVILLLLLSSAFLNTYYSTRDINDWWQEQNARKFMASLGVHADNVMSKAIYMRDVDEAIANSSTGLALDNSSSDCYSTFHDQVMQQNNQLGFSLPTSNAKDTVSKISVQRFQSTRERLGIYRHDLIVALRVVNSIERELVQNEWERWLRHELRRCRQVKILLKDIDEKKEADEGHLDESVFAEHTHNVKDWYHTYCTSCAREQERVELSHVGHGAAQPLIMYRE